MVDEVSRVNDGYHDNGKSGIGKIIHCPGENFSAIHHGNVRRHYLPFAGLRDDGKWGCSGWGDSLINPRPVFLIESADVNSSKMASRTPLINFPLFSVLNVFAISISSLIVTFGGISGK